MQKKYQLGFMLILALIIFDQLTKYLIVWLIPYNFENVNAIPSYQIIPNFLYITHHHNDGAAWGILSGQRIILFLITAFALTMFAFLFKDIAFKTKKMYTYAIIFLIAGTIGNFIDRLFLGYVIDFIDVYLGSYDFPIFNIADSLLTIGMIMFAYDILFLEGKRERV
ncbi:MAG: signal peptidase II [Candidatus Izemoplasmataceae bacterium]